MGSIYLCDECGGAGAIAFERGPAAEDCRRCTGVGLIASDETTVLTDLQALFSVSRSDEGVLVRAADGAEWRLLLVALARLQQRVERLERELGP